MRMIDETPTPETQGASCPPPHQRVRSTMCRFAMPLAISVMLVLGVVALAGAQQAQQVLPAGAQSVAVAEIGQGAAAEGALVAAAETEQVAVSTDSQIIDFAEV